MGPNPEVQRRAATHRTAPRGVRFNAEKTAWGGFHVRHRGLYRLARCDADHHRRAETPGVSRLRLGRLGRDRKRPHRSPARRRQAQSARGAAGGEAHPRADRHRPHPLGDARGAQRSQRASAPERDGRRGRRPQRHRRELRRAQGRAGGGGRPNSGPTPIPRSSFTWSSAIWTPAAICRRPPGRRSDS